MSQLAGKVALVTGASKGIGAGIARELAACGAAFVVNYATARVRDLLGQQECPGRHHRRAGQRIGPA